MTNDQFAEEFKRITAGMTDKEVADMCGISLPTVNRWKAGKSIPFSLARKQILRTTEMLMTKLILDKALHMLMTYQGATDDSGSRTAVVLRPFEIDTLAGLLEEVKTNITRVT